MHRHLARALALGPALVVAACSTPSGPPSADGAAIDAASPAPDATGGATDAWIAPRDAGTPTDAGRCAADAECDDGVFCNGTSRCDPTSAAADARGCVRDPASPCASGESCDEASRSCSMTCVDDDHDGACASADCDDADPARHPMAHEVCDAGGVDEDCDPATLGGDADGDGHAAPSCCNALTGGALACGDDCDDARADVFPAAAELCDPMPGVDEDCDGTVNEGCVCETGTSRSCVALGACAAGDELCAGASWGPCSVVPTSEACNGADDDCDGTTDEGTQIPCYPDEDGDGYAGDMVMPLAVCAEPGREAFGGCPLGTTALAPTAGAIDCLYLNAAVHPGAPEVCTTAPRRDDDCDGVVDEGCACLLGQMREPCVAAGVCGEWYTRETCQLVGGVASWVCDTPPGTETCDGLDDDCDGLVDEGLLVRCWADLDHDGYAAAGAAVAMRCGCDAASGWTGREPTASAADCDDRRAEAHPGASDPYDNGLDDDCDGVDGPIGRTIFVSSLGVDGRDGRSVANAVRTVARGRALAASCATSPCTVVVTTGTFAEAHVVTSGVNMWGGYGTTFAGLVAGGETILDGGVVGLRAASITSPTRIGRFRIRSADAVGTEAASIAVLVTQTMVAELELVDVTLQSGRGRDGAPGLDAAAAPTCVRAAGGGGGSGSGCRGFPSGAGAAGTTSSDGGAGGSVGVLADPHGVRMGWGYPGSDSCGDGCDPSPGVGFDGMDGFPGPAAQGGVHGVSPYWGALDASGVFATSFAMAGSAGHPGGGGGGGGEGGDATYGLFCAECLTSDSLAAGCAASADCSPSDPQNGANGGAGGAGGCGGVGGGGGGDGGGSFGVVAIASRIRLTRVHVTLGAGGSGGAGGRGSAGTPGLAGAGDGSREECCVARGGTCHRELSGHGGSGGDGGAGSAGGGGAGGDAGPMVGVALVMGATLLATLPGDLMLSAPVMRGAGGAPGVSGASGGAPAPSASQAGRSSSFVAVHAY